MPEGNYQIRCDKAEHKLTGKQSKTPGASMAEAHFTIFGPEELEEFHGRKVFENFMLSGEGMFRVRQFLEVTGEDENFILEDTDQLLGRECGAVIQVEKERKDPDTGVTYPERNRIARYVPIE